MTKLVLLFQQTESTIDIVADYMLETTVILLTNPQAFSSSKHTEVEGPMLMTHYTIFVSAIVLQILCLLENPFRLETSKLSGNLKIIYSKWVTFQKGVYLEHLKSI